MTWASLLDRAGVEIAKIWLTDFDIDPEECAVEVEEPTEIEVLTGGIPLWLRIPAADPDGMATYLVLASWAQAPFVRFPAIQRGDIVKFMPGQFQAFFPERTAV